MKKFVKKITAIGAGLGMFTMTLSGAMALDLTDYEDTFKGAATVVIGDGVTADSDAATTVAEYLATDAEEALADDNWKAETSADRMELGESIYDVKEYLTDSELDALADGEITNEKGTAKYDQFLYFGDQNTSMAFFDESDDDEVGLFFKIGSDKVIGRYRASFTSYLKSDVTSTSHLDDIEDEEITMMGQTYTIVTVTNSTNDIEMTLMGGAIIDTMGEGEEATYEIDGVEYVVNLYSVASDGGTNKAKFEVDGVLTSALADGDTDKTDAGLNIGVSDITYQDYAGGIHSAKFFLGADKIVLLNGSSMTVNDETINDAAVDIGMTVSSGDIHITSIQVNMTAEDDFWLLEGDKLSEDNNLDYPEALFTQNWDLEYKGLADVEYDEVKINPTGSDAKYELSFVDGNDNYITLPIAFVNASGMFPGDKEAKQFIMNKSDRITKNDYFVLNSKDPISESNSAETYALQYDSANDDGVTSPKLYFTELGTGDQHEVSMSAGNDAGDSSGMLSGDLSFHGVTYTFQNVSATSSKSYDIKLTSSNDFIDQSGAPSANLSKNNSHGLQQHIRTADNHLITILDQNISTGLTNDDIASTAFIFVNVTIDDTDLMDDDQTTAELVATYRLNATTSDEATATRIGAVGTAWGTQTDPDNSDITRGYTAFGAIFEDKDTSDDPPIVTIQLPGVQAEALVYVTAGTGASSAAAALEVVEAADVADVAAQNVIAVGGSCINSVTADFLGLTFPACVDDSGLSADEGVVSLVENGDNWALLVYGWEEADTARAADAVAAGLTVEEDAEDKTMVSV